MAIGKMQLLIAIGFPLVQAYVAPIVATQRGISEPTASTMMQRPQMIDEVVRQKSDGFSWNPLAFGMLLGLFAAAVVGKAPAALAADVDNGQAVFAGNCASCHAGGENVVAPDKKLKKSELQKYGKYEAPAILSIAKKGAGSMPAFGEKLAPSDLEDVAAYVRAQADKGW